MLVTDPDSLVVSTTSGNLGVNGNIWLDTTAKTFELAPFGDLTSAKEGVTGNAIWAKFVDLWTTSTYQPFPFPMNVLDARSGQYVFGQDPGGSFNGWKPANDATRQMIRDAGWSEYSAAGVLNRQYVGIVIGGQVPSGEQLYYQREVGGTPINFTFTDLPNEAIQVFGDASNGNFDTRTLFNVFSRPEAYTYGKKGLSDAFETATGPYKVSFSLESKVDTKITDNDTSVAANAPYTSINVQYFGTDQNKTIGAGSYPFRVVIDNTTANATLEEIYTKVQYLLRQTGDIDSGAGTVAGKTADELCFFVGDTLHTTKGVFIDGVTANDLNRVVFLDQNSVERTYPFASAGTLNFSANLVSGGTGYYRVYFTNDDAGDNAGADYGTSSAITVNDNSASPITGTISSGSISFTYDYDGNIQRGAASAGDDAPITVVAGNAGVTKPVVAAGTISRSKGISITLTAESDRAYIA